jgi:hypothetical protein
VSRSAERARGWACRSPVPTRSSTSGLMRSPIT